MRRDLPHWVGADCGHWGSQKLRALIGRDIHRESYIDGKGNLQYDVDGYAESLLGRIREERDGAAQSQLKQYWPEVLHGRALDVQRAIMAEPSCPETPVMVGTYHYVIPQDVLTIREKAKRLQLSKAQYWNELEIFEFWLFARLDPPSHCKASEKVLQQCPKTPTVRRVPVKVARVSPADIKLAALNRPILTLAE